MQDSMPEEHSSNRWIKPQLLLNHLRHLRGELLSKPSQVTRMSKPKWPSFIFKLTSGLLAFKILLSSR